MTLWSADLVEMQKLAKQNKGYRYVLMVINVFSKDGWADPLETKSKSTSAVTLAFKKIFKRFSKDYGLWIYNKTMEDLLQGQDILIFHP